MEVFWVSLLLIPCVMSASICKLFLQPPSDTDPVRCMKPEPAILGGDITLTCILSQHMEAFQVTWCEIKGNKSKDLASFSKIYGPLVKQEFSAFISIVPLDPDEYFNRSTIEILKWEKEDEACYGCYFNINHAEGVPGDVFLADIGNPHKLTKKAVGKWIWPPLAAVVVVATAAFFICKKHKRSSENSEDETSKDESQLKNTEETAIKNRDETPEKDFGGKRTENDGLLNHANGYSPRKLEFD